MVQIQKKISDRAARGTGMSKIIIEMLNYVPGGKFHFEIAIFLEMHKLFQQCCPAQKPGIEFRKKISENWEKWMKFI